MVESAERHIRFLEDEGYREIKVSLKAHDIAMTVEANRLFSERFEYPLHLGITEAGTLLAGTVKSAAGLGILLAAGIGDTIRVSLTADPVEEVRVARLLLDLARAQVRRRDAHLLPHLRPLLGRHDPHRRARGEAAGAR